MNLIATAHTFFYVGGAVMIAVAVLQWLGRPRAKATDRRGGPAFDAAMVRIALFVGVGILAILVGVGIIPMAGH